MSELPSLWKIEQADIERLFKEFRENLFSYLPDRYPEMPEYGRWRALVASYISEAKYCTDHAYEHLKEERG